MSYVQSNRFFYILLTTFIFLTIPLVLLPWFNYSYRPLIAFYTHIIVFTHFLSTIGLYTNSKNREHFAHSKSNIAIYYLIPISLLILLINLSLFGDPNSILITLVSILLIFADYFHTNKQSLGVLQMMRKGKIEKGLRIYYYLLIFTLMMNLLSKRYAFPLASISNLLLILTSFGFLFFLILISRDQNKKSAIYFLIQNLALIPGIINPRWYFLGLAVHSIEYHLLIIKRFKSERGSLLKSNTKLILFYLALITFSLLVHVPRKHPGTWLEYFNLGFFYSSVLAIHYYLDSFVWRFKKPIYQQAIEKLNHL